MSAEFIDSTVRNQIADKLKEAFFHYYRYQPPPAEVTSWRNSLRAMAQILDRSRLTEHGVLLEYQLPLSSKRLDCLVCGRDRSNDDNAVIVELKQWERCAEADPDKLVSTWIGGRERPTLHPSVQVGQYLQYLQDTHTAFYEGDSPVRLSGCAYLHNYSAQATDPLRAGKFSDAIVAYPFFDGDATDLLSDFLVNRLAGGVGRPVLDRVEQSGYRPSRKLMDYVADTVKTHSPWVLLDEQLVVFESILSAVRSGLFGKRKQVVLVRGGPQRSVRNWVARIY